MTKGDSGSDSGASVSTPHTQEKLCNKQYDTQEAPFGSTSRREHSLDRRNKHRIASPFRSTTQAPIRHRTDRRRSRAEAITRRPGKVRVPGNLQGPGQQRRRLPPKQTVRQPAGASRRRPVLHQARARQHAKGATERDTNKRDHRKGHGKKQQTEGTETEGSHQKGAPNGTPKGTLLAERLLQRLPCRAVPYRTRRLQRYQWKHRRTQTRTEPNSGQRTPSIIGPTIAVLVTQRFAQQQQKLQHYWRQQQWGSGDKDNGAG